MEDKIKKRRSPNFPSISLKEAMVKVKLLYDASNQTPVNVQSVYTSLGYKGRNGASITMLSALKKYDLIREENTRIFVTDSARFILILDVTDAKRKDALSKCALNPEIYRNLYDRFKERGLPKDQVLKSELLTEYNFNEKSVSKFITDLRETFEFANISFGEGETTEDKREEKPETQIKPKMQGATVKEFLIPRKNDRLASFRLEMPISKDEVDKLKKWFVFQLDYLKEMSEEQEEEEEQGN